MPGPTTSTSRRRSCAAFGLRTGDTVEGEIRGPKEGERYFALTRVITINFDDPDTGPSPRQFRQPDAPLYPDEKLKLDTLDPTIKDKSARVIDIVAPLGKGQRALIVSPPRTGKTVLLQNIARAITDNNPEVILIVLLIDERAGRGHRHAALGPWRGHLLDLRRACVAPRPGCRNGDRKGQAPRRTQKGRRDTC